MIFDFLMLPFDSYWKRQCKQERMKRERAESNARYAEKKMRYQDEDYSKMLAKDAAQSQTIAACVQDRQQLLDEIEHLREEIDMMNKSMELMSDTIRAQKETIFAFKAMGLKTREAEA